MAHADYEFYKGVYYGNLIGPKAWPALAVTASAYIDRLIFYRIKQGAKMTENMRMAVYAVAEA